MAHNFTKEQVYDAVVCSNGTYVSVAKYLRCKSSMTSKKFVEKYPDILQLMNEKQESMVDVAKDVLMNNLKSKNDVVRQRACEFVLKYCPVSKWKELAGEDVQGQLVKLLDKMMTNTEVEDKPKAKLSPLKYERSDNKDFGVV